MYITYVFEKDCYGFDIEYEYELTPSEVDEAMRHILENLPQEDLIDLLIDFDSKDDLINYYEDEISHYYEEDAKAAYFESKDCFPEGLSHRDFILGDFYE